MYAYLGNVITESETLPNTAIVCSDDGIIREIQTPSRVDHRIVKRDFGSHWIAPGFVDMHVHGGGGGDFMSASSECIERILETHTRCGTTTLLATTLSASRHDTDRAIRAIVEAARGESTTAQIAGIHLEGPYICAARRGAQPGPAVRPGSVDEFGHWWTLSEGTIKQITIAPEQNGSEEVIRAAVSNGIVVSAGHTDASAMDAMDAIVLGVRQVTHLFNAMRPLHHREPGLLGAALVSPVLKCEIIADGVHVAPMVVRLAHLAKGDSGIILVTDAIEGASMPDGIYSLGGQDVHVQNGTAAFADGTLAGSVLTMNRAWKNIMDFADVAPSSASQMASLNAAKQLGLDSVIGSIALGKRADLVALHHNGTVEATIIRGDIVYAR